MTDTKPYRPSNGTEGDIFMGHFCAHCAFNDLDEDACAIQLAALAFDIDAPEYPKEWIIRNGNAPSCTAFRLSQEHGGDELAFRCNQTPDMFGEAV